MSGRAAGSWKAQFWRSGLLAGLWLVAGGCTGPPAGVVPVSGRVTLSGQPLAGAVVTFQPLTSGSDSVAPAGGSCGRTDAQGRFTLTLIDPSVPGALAGQHVVTITTAKTGSDDTARPTGERVPKPWRDGSQTFEVPAGGTSSADFDLP